MTINCFKSAKLLQYNKQQVVFLIGRQFLIERPLRLLSNHCGATQHFRDSKKKKKIVSFNPEFNIDIEFTLKKKQTNI